MTKKILMAAVLLTLAGCAAKNGRDGMDGFGVAAGTRMVLEQRR